MFQKDILQLFDTFRVENKSQYHALPPGDKPYFLGRLYKAFVRNTNEGLTDAKNTGGVKFHFRTTGDLTDKNPNLPNETFLKKTSFYANRTFITFPFREIKNKKQLRLLQSKPPHAWPKARHALKNEMLFGEITRGTRTGLGGVPGVVGKVYTIDAQAFDDLLSVFFQLAPAIKAGIAQILPMFPDDKARFRDSRLGWTSANFNLPDLQAQFFEAQAADVPDRKPYGLSHLLLPHFTAIPFERIIEIREKEAELYWELQRRLENLLIGASSTTSETIILNFLREVDSGVRELHRKFKDIEIAYRRKNIFMLVKFICVGLSVMAPLQPEVKKSLATILGGISAFDYLTTKEDKAKSLADLRNSQFYLPWLVFKGGAQ